MSKYARMKSTAGGAAIPTVASAATVTLPDESNVFFISGTTTITSLKSWGTILPGREVTFIGTETTGNVFTNTTSPTTAGTMGLGGGNIRVDDGDVLKLVEESTGVWRLVSYQQATP